MGWGSSTRMGGGRKVRALPRKFVFLGFRREELGMSRDFCRDVPDPCRGFAKGVAGTVSACRFRFFPFFSVFFRFFPFHFQKKNGETLFARPLLRNPDPGGVQKVCAKKVCAHFFRDGETTIKIKFSLLRGGGLGGREENCPKTLFFMGNATTIEF